MGQAFDPYHKWLGIPPAEQKPNHYRLLGLTLFESDTDVILSAAEQRIAHVRTFQISQHAELSQRILNELAAARVCLLNAQRKAAYDARLRRKLSSPKADIGNYAQSLPTSRPLASRKTLLRPASNRHVAVLATACVAIALACVMAFAWSAFRAAKRAGNEQPPLDVADSLGGAEPRVVVGTVQVNPVESVADSASSVAPPTPVEAANASAAGSTVPPPAVDSASSAPAADPEPPVAPPSDLASPTPSEPATPAPMPSVHPSESPAPMPPAPAGPSPPPTAAPFSAEQAKQHQEAWAKYLGKPITETNSIGMQLVLIPPGEFDMGSSQKDINGWVRAGFQLESPKHRVRISSPFWMSAYEVKVGEFRKFLQAAGREATLPRYTLGGHELDDDYPADAVVCDSASAFCQ